MPRLPSGRHYALDAQSLQELLHATHRSQRLTELLRIRHPKHLYPYVDVITFGDTLDGNDPPLSPYSAPLPPGLAPRPTEYTLATLPVGRRDRYWSDWSNSDDDAWREFVASPRVCAYLDALLAEVEAQREHLRRHGSPLDQQQLAQWDANRHPMQGERGDTQAIARNLMAMVGVLYDRGHQRLTFLPHIGGAGSYRYLLTVEDPPRFPRGDVEPEVATTVWDSLAGGGLAWVVDPLASPVALAEAFLARYPRIARLSVGERPGVAGWYGEMMRVTGPFGIVVYWLDGPGLERGQAEVIGKEGVERIALPAELADLVPPFEQ